MAALTVIDFPPQPDAFDVEAQAEFVAADAGGDTFVNDGHTGLYVKNTDPAARTVTIVARRRCNHGELHDSAINVPAGFAGYVAHELPAGRFNDDQNIVTITYSTEVGLEVAAVRRHQ